MNVVVLLHVQSIKCWVLTGKDIRNYSELYIRKAKHDHYWGCFVLNRCQNFDAHLLSYQQK